MGTDDLFKKRRAKREPRKSGSRLPKANSYLIVTEGGKTEPLYLNGIRERIKEVRGGNIDIHIKGEGRSTFSLLRKANELVRGAHIIYQNVWLVFDKDDFEDFDQAIEEAGKAGYKVAWSNQSFEYWLYLHFEYSDVALHRNDWTAKFSEILKRNRLSKKGYEKNLKNIYTVVDTYNGVDTAIKHAKRRMVDYESSKCKPSEYDPGTTVHILVGDLKEYLRER